LFFFAIPAVLKILITFGVILLVSRFVPLYVGLFVGSLTIGLWMGMDAHKVVLAVLHEVSSGPCLWLALMVGLILVLSDLLARSGQLDRIVAAFQNISPGPRFTLVTMPALIGLLPMPGGALFSAPMVEMAVGEAEMKPELKVVVNYWFRHVWEFWWPLYPGVILAVSLFGVPTWQWAIALSPLTLGALMGGLLFIMPCLPPIADVRGTISRPALRLFLSEIMPITLLVILIFGIQGLVTEIGGSWQTLAKWPPQLSFSLALAVTIATVTRRNSLSMGDFKSACLNRAGLPMVMIVFGAMAFKGCLIESGAIEQVRSELAACHIPVWAVVALLPFISAFVTGIAVAFVGTSLPLVVSLIPEGQSPFAFAALAYGFGFLGMMLSPIHICLLVTSEYFCADPMAGYRFIWKPAALCVAWTVALFIGYEVAFG
jgi:uncharacterized protein